MRKAAVITACAVVSMAALLLAQMPRLLNYQGKLTTALGVPVDGVRDFQFSLYTVASNGASLWTENHINTPVQKGYYSVELGSITAIPDNVDFLYGAWYLGVCVRTNGGAWGDELLPRTRILPGVLAFSLPSVLKQIASLSNQGLMASNLWQASPLAGIPAGEYGKTNVFFVDRDGRYSFTDLQAALNHIAAQNISAATIYVLAGTYPLAAPISLRPSGKTLHNILIIGDAVNRPVFVTSFDDYAFRAEGNGINPTNITLANIDIGTQAAPLLRGVYLNTQQSKISNCRVYSSLTVKGNSNWVMNNSIINRLGDALSVEGISNIVINNTISGSNAQHPACDIVTSAFSGSMTIMSNNLLAHGGVVTNMNLVPTNGVGYVYVDLNGRYDCTDIQSAFDIIADRNYTNAKVFVYPGEYAIDSPIHTTTKGKVLKNISVQSATATIPVVVPNYTGVYLNIVGTTSEKAANISISNIDFGRSTRGSMHGIYVLNASNVLVTNCALYASNSAISAENISQTRVYFSKNIQYQSIGVTNSSASEFSGLRVRSMLVQGSKSDKYSDVIIVQTNGDLPAFRLYDSCRTIVSDLSLVYTNIKNYPDGQVYQAPQGESCGASSDPPPPPPIEALSGAIPFDVRNAISNTISNVNMSIYMLVIGGGGNGTAVGLYVGGDSRYNILKPITLSYYADGWSSYTIEVGCYTPPPVCDEYNNCQEQPRVCEQVCNFAPKTFDPIYHYALADDFSVFDIRVNGTNCNDQISPRLY